MIEAVFLYLCFMAYDIEDTFKQILLAIEEGNSLRSVLKHEGMPDSTTFYKWIDNDKEKSIHYARACEKRADTIFEDILDIADDSSQDTLITEKGNEVLNSEWVQRSKLRIDARKWMLGKMQPKKYGDKSGLDIESTEDEEITEIKIIRIGSKS